jgi:hypothetical protein
MIQPLPEQDVDEYAAIIPALEQLIPSPGSADPLPGRVGSEYIDPCSRDFHSLGSLLAMQVSRVPTGLFIFEFMLVALHTRFRMRHINYRTIGLWLSDCNFFLLSNYWYRNIEYRIAEFKKLSDYRISDQDLNLSDYRILDSEKTTRIGCPDFMLSIQSASYGTMYEL